MTFDYLIALDLQVTSLHQATAASEEGHQEVIEFPWVVIDVAKKSIVESKVVYIKPEDCSELGDRCKAVTGLDESNVASGTTLQACVQELNDYLYKQFTSQNMDFCFVSDGDSSLKRWLRSDAKHKKVKLAAHYAKFIDLRAEFKQKYPKWAGVDSCPSMADRLGVELDLSVDGGSRMCSAMGAIILRLLEDGATFSKTVTIPDDYDPLVDPLFCKGGPRYAEPLRAKLMPGDTLPESTVVKCRGMPYSAQKSDLEDFFAGCKIAEDGIWIVQNQFGRATGEAYVTLETAVEALKAVRRNRDLMNQRYVEVFASTQAECEAARASMAAGAGSTAAGGGAGGVGGDEGSFGGVVKLRGLPYTTSYDDVRRFFDGLVVKADGITLCENREGRNNGEAYVEFEDEASAYEAIKRDRMTIGARYVEVYKVCKADLANYLKNRAQVTAGVLGMGAALASGNEFFIKVRGLPFTAREQDIVAFFAKASVAPVGVSLVYNARDQPNGECYVEVASADDLSRALTLHRDSIGHRYVELFRTTRIEAMQALGMPGPTPAAQGFMASMQAFAQMGYGGFGAAAYGAAPYGAAAAGGYGLAGVGGGAAALGPMPSSGLVKIRGLPYRASATDIADFFRGFSFHPELIQMALGPDGRPNGEAWCTFVSAEEAQRAIAMKNRQHIGNRYVEIFPA